MTEILAAPAGRFTAEVAGAPLVFLLHAYSAGVRPDPANLAAYRIVIEQSDE